MFDKVQLEVINYISQECMRQRSGEISVYNMAEAWDYAEKISRICLLCEAGMAGEAHKFERPKIDINFIVSIGKLVDPIANSNGIRTIPIFVGNSFEMVEKAPWEKVLDLLTLLLNSYYNGDMKSSYFHKKAATREDQFYFEYENIHPFVDGNGRTGKIIYNYLNVTLSKPVMPPNFWNSSNP